MKQQETIAVIGGEGQRAAIVVRELIKSPYRILLLDEVPEKRYSATSTPTDLSQKLERIGCCREASWEADIILLSDEITNLNEILEKMIEVASNKIVILISVEGSPAFRALQSSLPFSKLVDVQVKNGRDDSETPVYLIEGEDAAANNFVSSLLKSIGLKTFESPDHL